MTATLATGGRILSPASRDATAIAYEGGLVAWVGQDAPGPTLYPSARHIDLDGDWVAPAFVQCDVGAPGDHDPRVAAGTVRIELPVASGDADPVNIADRVAAGERILYSGSDIAAFASALTAAANLHGGPAVARCTPTLVNATDLRSATTELLAELARVGTVILLDPLGSGVAGLDLVALAGSGLVLATTLTDSARTIRPWAALRVLTAVSEEERSRPERGLSPRAAFTAATRGASRAAGVRDGTSGTLIPGTSATYARWRTGPLLVTAADDAVQRWSTDPRSGVPPMPDLTGPEPECLGLTVDGVDTSNPVS